MSTERIYKALANCEQGLSDTEKAQARSNIGAQGELTAGPNIDIYNDVISTEKPVVEAGTNVSVNSSLDPQTRVITYTVSATDTTYNVFNTTTDGLVPKANGTGDTGKFLKGDGTWESINTTVNATAPLYGTGTQADPIRLLVSHGLSLVHPAGGNTALQVTHPVPAPGSTSAGKVLTCDDVLGNLSWQTRPKFLWKTFFAVGGSAALTATDISNGYVDWPMDWNLEGDGLYVTNFTFTMLINDASFYRGSTSRDISGVCDKVKISFWDSTHTWYSNDNAHGNDPVGMLFNDIPSSALVRVGGYPTLATPIRETGGASNILIKFKGPSVRFMLNAGAQEGDTLHLSGFIAGINYESGV